MQLGITQIDFSNTSSGGAVLHIFGRDKDARPHRIDLTGFVPYYFIPLEQADKMEHPNAMEIDKTRTYKSIYGDELRRVNCPSSPIDIHVTKNLYQHFEADIPYHVRYMIDNHITSGIETDSELCDYRTVKPCDIKTPSRVCFLDIECSDEKGFPEPERDPVTAITMYDNFDDKYTTLVLNMTGNPVQIEDPPHRKTLVFDEERKLLKAFCDYIKQKDPDIISGWNVRDFDMDYLIRRMEVFELNISLISRLPPTYGDKRNKTNVRGRNIFDLLEAYKKITTASGKRESYRLDAIAEFELKEHKVHFEGSLDKLLRENPQKFVDYNFKDVELCVGIDKKSKIIDFYRELASFVGCPLDKTLDSSSVVDIYVLRKAHDKGFILPSKGFASEEKFEGATVFSPSKGIEENVIVLDLKSLYPMCMITMNASPETKDPKGELHSPNGIHFKKEPIGLVREIILELLEQRDAKKKAMKQYKKGTPEYDILDQQQNVLKIIMNTYYGVSGYARFRMFDNEIASAITSAGREIIEFTRKYVESKGYSVKYGDSVAGDSKILIYDQNTNSKLINIQDLFTHVDYSIDNKEYCNLINTYTDTIDINGKNILSKVPYVMRHKCNKKMYRVWITNQWYIDVTEDHSLFGYLSESLHSKMSVNERLIELKPTNINHTSLVIKSHAHRNINSMNYSREVYELLGFFIGDGSFDKPYPRLNYYGHLACGKDQQEIVDKLFIPLQKQGYIKSYWIKSKGDISFNGEIVKILNTYIRTDKFNSCNGTLKQIPKFMYHETNENIQSFIRGLYSSDGTYIKRDNSIIIRYTTVLKDLSNDINQLLHLIGIASSIYKENTHNKYNEKISKTYSYHVNIKDNHRFKDTVGCVLNRQSHIVNLLNNHKNYKENLSKYEFNISRVKNVDEIDYNDYVYDIEVEKTHRFFANNILVHNTDSSFIKIHGVTDPEEIKKLAFELERELNEQYPKFAKDYLNADVSFFSTKFEKYYRRFFQGGKKKRYAGHIIWKEGQVIDEIDVVGFEVKRSDSPQLARDVMKKILEMVLRGSTKEDVRTYLSNVIKKYRKGEYSYDLIGIPGGIGKNLEDYDIADAHVRGCKYANEHLGALFLKGSKPKRLYIKSVSSKYPQTDVICFEYGGQVPKEFNVDYNVMFDKTIKSPLERIFEPMGWSFSEFDPEKTTLSMFGIGD